MRKSISRRSSLRDRDTSQARDPRDCLADHEVGNSPTNYVSSGRRVSVLAEDVGSSGGLTRENSHFRASLDFDGDGLVQDFEIYYANLLDQAKEGRKIDLTSDVWGCAIYTTVTDLPAILSGTMTYRNALRFSYISLIAILNLVLQFFLLFWITEYVLEPSMKFSQDAYAQFHSNYFSADGYFFQSQFNDLDAGEDLCKFPIIDRWFTCAVLFLWVSQCFVEVRSSQRIFSSLQVLPTLPWGISYELMVHAGLHETADAHGEIHRFRGILQDIQDRNSDGEVGQLADAMQRMYTVLGETYFADQSVIYLVCLSPMTRISIILLVLVPRMVIIVVLTTIGCVWLQATDRFDELILNALALEFVVNVDNLLFSMFLPVSLHHEVETLKVALPKEDSPLEAGETQQSPVSRTSGMRRTAVSTSAQGDKSGYYRSFLYLLTVIAVVFISECFQPVLPGFDGDLRSACQAYMQSWESPRYELTSAAKVKAIFSCTTGGAVCFPYGN